MNENEVLNRYRRLPYKRRVEKVVDEREGTYFLCTYPDLPGLIADGDTRAEAVKNAAEAFDDYILARIHFGDVIPEPQGAQRVARSFEISERVTKADVRLTIGVSVPNVVIAKAVVRSTVEAALKRPSPPTTSAADAPNRIQSELLALPT